MHTNTQIGIWMDHSHAHLITFNPEFSRETITSKFDHTIKLSALSKGEKSMHNKEHHFQTKYYNEIITEIKKYTDVLLFGPTDAKQELHNLLKNENGVSSIKITLKDEDKMTENQEKEIVKIFFNK